MNTVPTGSGSGSATLLGETEKLNFPYEVIRVPDKKEAPILV
jgi:hypothetical protein